MSSSLRLAICGLGLIGRRHADAMALMPEAELVAIVEPSDAGAASAAERGVPCYARLDEMLAKERLDGIVLATPTLMHVDQAQLAMQAGLPVLVEKPISTTAAEAAVLVEEASARGVPILVGHHRRYNPLIQKAKELITSDRIGDVRAVQGTCWFYKPDNYFDVAPWRKKVGAGPVSVNLVHDIDLIRYLCGEIIRVQAAATPSLRGYENEDVASAMFTFDTGVVGTVTVSDSIAAPWSWEMTSRENPAYAATAESCYLIGGSKGSLSIPDLRVWSHAAASPDWWSPISTTVMPWEASDPLLNQMRHFCEVIRGEAEPLVPGEEGIRNLQVIEAIQQAAQTGQAVKIEQLSIGGGEREVATAH